MSKLTRILVLVMALSVYVQAGDIQNGVTNPPQPEPTAVGEVSPNGDIQNGVTAEDESEESSALALLLALLSIF